MVEEYNTRTESNSLPQTKLQKNLWGFIQVGKVNYVRLTVRYYLGVSTRSLQDSLLLIKFTYSGMLEKPVIVIIEDNDIKNKDMVILSKDFNVKSLSLINCNIKS